MLNKSLFIYWSWALYLTLCYIQALLSRYPASYASGNMLTTLLQKSLFISWSCAVTLYFQSHNSRLERLQNNASTSLVWREVYLFVLLFLDENFSTTRSPETFQQLGRPFDPIWILLRPVEVCSVFEQSRGTVSALTWVLWSCHLCSDYLSLGWLALVCFETEFHHWITMKDKNMIVVY